MSKCFVHLGRYGDLLILFPGFKHLRDTTGINPVVVVARQFADIFEGISYATPLPLDVVFHKDVGKAKQIAMQHYKEVIVPKWWDEPNAEPPKIKRDDVPVRITAHGRTFEIPAQKWKSYQESQWEYAGFKMEHLFTLPLVFDCRDLIREQSLAEKVAKWRKPVVLVNLAGGGSSSPFAFKPEVMQVVNRYRAFIEIVDLSMVTAYRIYDLLGLYDRSSLLITSDTATLHLAMSHKIPMVAYIQNGGLGSIPKGNTVMQCRYCDTMQSLNNLENIIKNVASRNSLSPA